MKRRWPFSEESGEWDGKTYRWTSARGISIAQAKALTALFPEWTWNVRELQDGEYEFALTRRSAEAEREEAPPKRRRHRWSGAAK